MCYKEDLKLLSGWLRVRETVRGHASHNTNANRARNERRREIVRWVRYWRRRNLAAYNRYQRNAGMCVAG